MTTNCMVTVKSNLIYKNIISNAYDFNKNSPQFTNTSFSRHIYFIE